MKKILVLLFIYMSLLLISCSVEVVEEHIKEKIVEVEIVETTILLEKVYYFGFIEPEKIKKYAMKTGGTIENIYVEVGDEIKVGDTLLSLDSYVYDLGTQSSSEQIRLAKLELEKAIEARDFYKKTYEDSSVLYGSGAISKLQLDEIKLKYDISTKEVEQATKVINQASIDYDFKSSNLEDTILFSDMDGYIVDVLNLEGELIAGGYPVILARTKENIVKVGLSEVDVKKVSLEDTVEVLVDGEKYIGKISKINLMVDRLSRTYDIEVSLSSGSFIIGESCKVFITLSEVEGIWLDIDDISNDGVDYVYIVENNRATRRDIETLEVNGSSVRVTNLNDGDKIIVTGRNSLSEGYKVKIGDDIDE